MRLLLTFGLWCVITISFAQNIVPIFSASSKLEPNASNPLEMALDGDVSTFYHSRYDLKIPDTLDFYFDRAKSINQLRYTPRDNRGNGNWLSVDMYYDTEAGPENYIKAQTFVWTEDEVVKIGNLTNTIIQPRSIRLIVTSAIGEFSSAAEIEFLSAEVGNLATSECDLVNVTESVFPIDTKITGITATGGDANSDLELIANTLDGNFSTIYHSNYGQNVSVDNVTLTYQFSEAPRVDYLVYHPRRNGNGEGNFGEFTVQYRKTGEQSYTVVGSYDAGFSMMPTQVSFPSGL